jgi:hypothetical protein
MPSSSMSEGETLDPVRSQRNELIHLRLHQDGSLGLDSVGAGWLNDLLQAFSQT